MREVKLNAYRVIQGFSWGNFVSARLSDYRVVNNLSHQNSYIAPRLVRGKR